MGDICGNSSGQHCIFFDSLLGKLQSNGLIIYLSSRSALYPSRDMMYSAVKAGMSAALKSMTLQMEPGQAVFSLAPGLIRGSGMYLDMPELTRDDHEKRSKGKLLKVDEFAIELFHVIDHRQDYKNGSIVEIGIRYG